MAKNNEVDLEVIKAMVDEIPKRRIFFYPQIRSDLCAEEYFKRTGLIVSWNWLVKEAILKEISRRQVARGVKHFLEGKIARGEIYIGQK